MQTKNKQELDSKQYANLAEMFMAKSALLGTKTALHFKQRGASYESLSWLEFNLLVSELANGLAACGLKSGESVGIFAQTSHLWVAADLATIGNGAVSVPLYPTCSNDDIEYILTNSNTSVIFVSGRALLQRLLRTKNVLSIIRTIIFIPAANERSVKTDIKEADTLPPGVLLTLKELREAGRLLAAKEPRLLNNRIAQIKRDDFATIIYTSGTTGIPKGVPLTHGNILSVLEDLPDIIRLKPTDIYFSYLPLSHVFERICGEFYWIFRGCECAYAESIELLSKNMTEINPSIMLVVPRVLDRIYNKVKNGIDGANSKAQKLINWAIGIGSQILRLKSEDKFINPILFIEYCLAEKLVFTKLRNRIGPRLRCIISGGAPATPHVIDFFNSIGLTVLEGYGLTETSAPTHVNRFEKLIIGTVGPKLPSVELKLADDGEILLKGPSIFQGYFKDEISTAAAFIDGWFRTGDIGTLDEHGYLKITDRKKDLIINAAGKNIAPQRIECILKTIPHVNQVVVFGDKRKHLIALFTLDQPGIIELAQERGWDCNDFKEAASSTHLHRYLKDEIHKRSHELAEYEMVRNFAVLPEDLVIENGELTATLKVKRNVVAQRFADVINTLYRDEVTV